MMKTVNTNGITSIEPIPGTAGAWYFGLEIGSLDLYDAEDLVRSGHAIEGKSLCLVHYPDGQVYVPVPKTEDHFCQSPVFHEDGIFFLDSDFSAGQLRIMRFDCREHQTSVHAQLPLSAVTDCYNLRLWTSPLTLSRQRGEEFEIVWPEKIHLSMDPHDSFFLRDGEKLFFSHWHEEGEGADYRYWEETIVRSLNGDVIETLPGDVIRMPNGELWHLV